MLSIALIVFREILEAAIVTGIVMAATRDLPKRNQWVSIGIVLGIMGASLLALGTSAIAQILEGRGQEIFNALLLSLAVFMIGWTVIWMKRHVFALTSHLKEIGNAVSAGQLPLYTLAIVIATAVLREGAEAVLFCYGLLVSKTVTVPDIGIGGLIGLVGGIVIGTLFYCGLLKVSRKYIFTVTSWLLILLAAGMAAQAANFFVAAGLLPELVSNVWNSSWLITEQSITGRILHTLIGYSESPSAIQLIAYGSTVAIMGSLLRRSSQQVSKQAAPQNSSIARISPLSRLRERGRG